MPPFANNLLTVLTSICAALLGFFLKGMIDAATAVSACARALPPGLIRAAQSVIVTTEGAKTAKDLHYAGVTTPEQEKKIAELLDASAKAEDAYYASIRAGDSAALKAAKASWAAASSALAAELAKYHLPTTPATAPATKP